MFNLENSVHGGLPITRYGCSSAISRLARALSSARRKSHFRPAASATMSKVVPAARFMERTLRNSFVTRGGEYSSATFALAASAPTPYTSSISSSDVASARTASGVSAGSASVRSPSSISSLARTRPTSMPSSSILASASCTKSSFSPSAAAAAPQTAPQAASSSADAADDACGAGAAADADAARAACRARSRAAKSPQSSSAAAPRATMGVAGAGKWGGVLKRCVFVDSSVFPRFLSTPLVGSTDEVVSTGRPAAGTAAAAAAAAASAASSAASDSAAQAARTRASAAAQRGSPASRSSPSRRTRHSLRCATPCARAPSRTMVHLRQPAVYPHVSRSARVINTPRGR